MYYEKQKKQVTDVLKKYLDLPLDLCGEIIKFLECTDWRIIASSEPNIDYFVGVVKNCNIAASIHDLNKFVLYEASTLKLMGEYQEDPGSRIDQVEFTSDGQFFIYTKVDKNQNMVFVVRKTCNFETCLILPHREAYGKLYYIYTGRDPDAFYVHATRVVITVKKDTNNEWRRIKHKYSSSAFVARFGSNYVRTGYRKDYPLEQDVTDVNTETMTATVGESRIGIPDSYWIDSNTALSAWSIHTQYQYKGYIQKQLFLIEYCTFIDIKTT